MDCASKATDSHSWKGIIKSLNMVKGGYGWSVGDGSKISLWFDIWVDQEPLCLDIEVIDPDEITWTVSDVIDDDGNWALHRLNTNIASEVVNKITRIQLSSIGLEEDGIVWKGSKDGMITAKSFYKFVNREEEEEETTKWNWIWKLKCPQKIRMFIWLVEHERLVTNDYRRRIGASDTGICNICNLHPETILHLLRDCTGSRKVWEVVIPNSKRLWFFNLPVDKWVKENAKDVNHFGHCLNLDWTNYFLALLWHIWKARNDFNFQQIQISPFQIVRQAATYATDMRLTGNQFLTLNVDPVNGRWACPPPGYVKLNVDGSYRDGRGTYGGILRDEEGNWIWGFTGRCENSSPLHAELMGLREGLTALRVRGILRALVETDSSQVVHLVHGFPDESHPLLGTIMECKSIHKNIWSASIMYVSRNYNESAHHLASLGHSSGVQDGTTWFVSPPASVVDIVIRDKQVV